MKVKLLVVLLLALLGAACNRLSMDNYQKLHSGMSYEEVEQILGRATRCDETIGVKNCVWGDEQRNITVKFVANKTLLVSSTNIR